MPGSRFQVCKRRGDLSARVAAVTVRIELVLVDLTAQRIAVDAENFGGAGLVAVCAVQDVFDKTLFKFADRLVKQNTALYHLIDEPFQLIFHDGTLRSRTYGVRAWVSSPVRAQPECERPPGIWREWLRQPREAVPGRAGLSATAFARGSREQTVCQKRPGGRQGCNVRRARSGMNQA